MKIQGHIVDNIDVHAIVTSIFKDTQHHKRTISIANAALGVIASASLIIHRIGRGLASSSSRRNITN